MTSTPPPTGSVEIVGNRDWKLREEYDKWLDKEVDEYAEPIVTFYHRRSEAESCIAR